MDSGRARGRLRAEVPVTSAHTVDEWSAVAYLSAVRFRDQPRASGHDAGTLFGDECGAGSAERIQGRCDFTPGVSWASADRAEVATPRCVLSRFANAPSARAEAQRRES